MVERDPHIVRRPDQTPAMPSRNTSPSARRPLTSARESVWLGAAVLAELAIAAIDAITGDRVILTGFFIVPPLALATVFATVSADRRELARVVFAEALLGTITPVATRQGSRTFTVVPRST